MHPLEEHYLNITRRRFFGRTAAGLTASLGGLGLGSLVTSASQAATFDAATPVGSDAEAILRRGFHHAPKAKRVIYMHMEGAPSQLDLFDYKPGLRERFNEDLPDSIRDGQRLTGMTSGQARFPIAPSIFKFTRRPISVCNSSCSNSTSCPFLPMIRPGRATNRMTLTSSRVRSISMRSIPALRYCCF